MASWLEAHAPTVWRQERRDREAASHSQGRAMKGWSRILIAFVFLGVIATLIWDDIFGSSPGDDRAVPSGTQQVNDDAGQTGNRLPEIRGEPGAPLTESPSPGRERAGQNYQPVAVGKPSRARTVGPLSEDERETGAKVLSRSATLTRILAGQRYKVKLAIPWITDSRRDDPPPREVKLGATIMVELDQTVTRRVRWPLVTCPAAGSTAPYREIDRTWTVRELRELMINVDLKRERVVSITPHLAKVIPPKGVERKRRPEC